MILTVTLNVSVDKAYIVRDFAVGDVTRVKDVMCTAGGKGLNVARAVNTLGEDVLATGFIGGYQGNFVSKELDTEGIPYKFMDVEGQTRSCINIIDENNGMQTELLEPGPLLSIEDVNNFIDLYKSLITKSNIVTLSGSVPKGVDTDIYKKLVEIAKQEGKKVILDCSGEFLIKGMQAGPTLIKPNKTEAEAILGKNLNSIKEVAKAAENFTTMGPEIVAISLGAEGVVVAKNSDQIWAKPPSIKPKNTVGCGDAMVAGFAISLLKGYDIENLAKFAVAVSSASALNERTGGVNIDKIHTVLKNLSCMKI